MPVIGFTYPNGDKLLLSQLDSVDARKMGITMPTLRALALQRDNNRPPSTTELIIGTCEAYLKRKHNYFINPQDKAFALAGTMHHLKLEKHADENFICEEPLEGFGITGIPDLYDIKNEILYDYKNTGSYKVSKSLGMSFMMVDDPSGALYKVSGKWGKAGTPKKVKQWYVDPEKADPEDWTLQLNLYRLFLEEKGYNVKKIYVQATVRDGGIMASRDRGISRNIYLIHIPIMSYESVMEYFKEKRDNLIHALKTDTLPVMCSKEETWDGKKCEKYCDARSFCPYINSGESEDGAS